MSEQPWWAGIVTELAEDWLSPDVKEATPHPIGTVRPVKKDYTIIYVSAGVGVIVLLIVVLLFKRKRR